MLLKVKAVGQEVQRFISRTNTNMKPQNKNPPGREKKRRRQTSCEDSPIHVFLWRDGVGDEVGVDVVNGVQRQLDDQTVDGRVLVGTHDALQDLQHHRKQETVRAAASATAGCLRGRHTPRPASPSSAASRVSHRFQSADEKLKELPKLQQSASLCPLCFTVKVTLASFYSVSGAT